MRGTQPSPAPTPAQVDAVRRLLAEGARNRSGIARLVGISDRQVRKIAAGEA